MKRAVWALVTAMAAAAAGAEVTISAGGSGELTLPGALAVGELRAAGSGSLYHPLGEAVSLLLDTAADVVWQPAASTVTGSASLLGQVGLQTGALLSRLRIGAKGQGSVAQSITSAPGASGDLSAGLLLSWEGEAARLSVEPDARLYGGDRLRWGTGVRVTFEALAADRLILSASAASDARFPVDGAPEPGLSADVSAEWFIDAPVALSATAGIERRFSSNVETLDVEGVPVAVPGYWGFLLLRGDARASAALGRSWSLRVELAAAYRRGDYGVLQGTTVLPEKSWSLDIAPSVELGVKLAKRLDLVALLADTLTLKAGVDTTNRTSVSLEARLSFP